MYHFALIGHPVAHSFSADYHNRKFAEMDIDAEYKLVDLPDPSLLSDIIGGGRYDGFNITIPHKCAVISCLDRLSPEAEAVGAVNVISFEGKHAVGHNTDVTGFRNSLLPHLVGYETTSCKGHYNISALILGSGGASMAVQYVLRQLGIPFSIVSRTAHDRKDTNVCHISYDNLTTDLIRCNHLIINTTPLGMHPNVNTKPDIPYDGLTPSHLLYDLVYNPADTLFLQQGRAHGASVVGGLAMLHSQADASLNIWLKDLKL